MRLKRLAQGNMKTSGKYDDSYWAKGIRLPNCTLYSLLRLWEEGIEEQPLFTYTNSSKGFPNAKLWWSYWKGDKGAKPKAGSVLVWGNANSQYGHVAICEDILEEKTDGSYVVQVSQSNYGGTYFEYKTYTIKQGVKTTGVGMAFLGCCYVDLNLGQATRDTSKHQIKVEGTNVLARDNANGNKISGMYVPIGIYDVLDSKEVNGITWVKISEGVWCGAYTDLPQEKQEDYKAKYEEEVKEYNALALKYSELNDKYNAMTADYEAISNKLNKIKEIVL